MVTVNIDKDVHGGKTFAQLRDDLPHIPEETLKDWHAKNGKQKPVKPAESENK